jgi:hypothetical protein
MAALAKAQGAFTRVRKDATGRMGNQSYQYASLDAMVEATRPALAAAGLAVSFWPQVLEGGRYRLTTMLAGAGGWVICHRDYEAMLGEDRNVRDRIDGTVKSDGLRESYYMRYAYRALCGIATADADDEPQDLPGAVPPRRPAQAVAPVAAAVSRPTAEQKGAIRVLIRDLGLTTAEAAVVCSAATGVASFGSLTEASADMMIAALQAHAPRSVEVTP